MCCEGGGSRVRCEGGEVEFLNCMKANAPKLGRQHMFGLPLRRSASVPFFYVPLCELIIFCRTYKKMGCGASSVKQPPPPPAAEEPIWRRNDPAKQESFHRRRKDSVTRMSHATQDAVRDMFSEYRRRSTSDEGEEPWEEGDTPRPNASTKKMRRLLGGSSDRVMTREGLRKILQDIDEELFEFLWRLFDVDDVGAVDADNFVMAMGLLTQAIETVDDQIDAAFCMFDIKKLGVLSPEEFESMIKATVNLSLGHLLDTETGRKEFEAQLQKEYSEENLTFWSACAASTASSHPPSSMLPSGLSLRTSNQSSLPPCLLTSLPPCVRGV